MDTKDKDNLKIFPKSNNDNSDHSTKDKNWLRRIFSNPDKAWNVINGSLAAAIIIAISGSLLSIYTLKVNINSLTKDVSDLSKKMDEKASDLSEKFNTGYNDLNERIDNYEDNYTELNIQVGILQNINNIHNISATTSFQNSIYDLCQRDGANSVINAVWSDSEVIATDGNEKFTVKELSQEKLLLSYQENGQEVYFYGQYSENNKWDGDCIINVYENNKLILVTEASYNDGILDEYQQFYTFTTTSSEEVWCISKRKCMENGNIGDSWNYFKDRDFIKDFNLNDVEPSDIYTVSRLKKIIKEELRAPIEAFYHGMTVDGKYNDSNTKKKEIERSYLVKFSKYDGTVRTLYVGNFVDGKFKDDTGNAWYIVRDDSKINNKYMYYIGNFSNNTGIDESTEDNFKPDLTENEIKEIILPYFFKCNLSWHGFYKS